MPEDFQEADVLWPDAFENHHGDPSATAGGGSPVLHLVEMKGSASPPIDIPRRSTGVERWEEEEEVFCESMVPPHIMGSRRMAGEMTGGGRTGWREMSHLRHAVLRMTGFLES
ncbi:hypothetical protein HPP92_023715 [Vanilla planifolia]|uniref:Uncharacterized protein n=1 Tax=Vanilla planifolia TaxID=51239 RepID=A0A835PQU3_VANPL|nr:hypothetical protein HPP92_023715 [Vanilla planifolia]